MRKPLLIAIVVALPLVGAGCGEDTSVTVYKQGQYQGKTDTQPWDGDKFKGDKAAWENAIKTRNMSQNEAVRIAN